MKMIIGLKAWTRIDSDQRGRGQRWPRILALAPLLGGCLVDGQTQFFSQLTPEAVKATGQNPNPSPTPSPGSEGGGRQLRADRFLVPPRSAAKIDVLFCVDNSPSMEDNQRILAESFGGFITGFVNAGLDFHIGIVTSDVESESSSYWGAKLPDYPGANRGRLLSRYSGERFLTGTSSGLVSKFESNARVGIRGSAREQCLNSMIYATEASKVSSGGWNESFFRSDALHSFVVISDENEDIQDGERIEDRVERLKSQTKALASIASRGDRYDFIVNLSAPVPVSTPAPGQVQYYPGRYLAAAGILSGGTFDISRNFTQDLLSISEGMVNQVLREVTLSVRPVDPSALTVTINGELVVEGIDNGFRYHPDRNTVEFFGAALESSAGSEVVIRYAI